MATLVRSTSPDLQEEDESAHMEYAPRWENRFCESSEEDEEETKDE